MRSLATMRMAALSLALLSGLCSVAAGQVRPDEADRSNTDHFRRSAWFQWQRPDHIGRILAFEEGQYIADLGAGDGRYTRLLVETVFDTGRVYALESDTQALKQLQSGKVVSNEWGNFFPKAFDGRTIDIPDAELDVVLSVNYWHRLERPQDVAKECERVLKPGGRLVIIDWHDGPVEFAPPLEKRLDRDRLIAEMKSAGWLLSTESHALKYQYFLVFTRQS